MYILNLLPIHEEERADFQAAAPQATHVYAGRRTVTEEQLNQADAILGWPRASDLARCPNLKWVHCMWAGYDEYDAPGVLPQGVKLTTSSGTNSQSVAEHTLACLLSLYRKLPQARDNQRLHRWEELGSVRTLCGARVLVVGAGNVGLWFAGLCKSLGAYTVGLRRTVGQPPRELDELHTMDSLDGQLAQADVVLLALPGTGETAGLMSEERLGRMKPDAVLLSMGRGSVLDQQALCRALQEGRLGGAALDVTVPEPLPQDDPLWDAPNLIITAHQAGGMRLEITRKNCIALARENLRRYAAGEPLKNQVRG